ncbi:hypothetical protein D3C85_728500 [compost metagenome]
MACAFDQCVQADNQRFPAALDEPAHQHQHRNDRKNHSDSELKKACAQHAQCNPERTTQTEVLHLENDRRAENHDGGQCQSDHAGEQWGAPGKQQVNQNQQRDQQIPAFFYGA